MTLAERLPNLETTALVSLQVNARRLSAEAGTRGREADALLPLIEAELAKREEALPAKMVPARKKK